MNWRSDVSQAVIADSKTEPEALCVPQSIEAWNEAFWCKKGVQYKVGRLEAYEQWYLVVLVN